VRLRIAHVVDPDAIAQAAEDLAVWCEEDAAAGRAVDLTELSMRYALLPSGGP